ncbi:MAG: NAD-binding protein [Bacilli bacterium]|jgi:trk system potassium uptake protein TrkA
MKIVIAGGDHQADYIISMYKKERKDLIVINADKIFADYLSRKHRIPVYVGEPFKRYVLEETNIHDADIFIALCASDSDNYVACIMAKRLFNVKKCICTVHNPKNVVLFKRLGIDSVISSTYLLGESIKNEASIADMVRTLSLEDDEIAISEIIVNKSFNIVNKKIMDINFPQDANIACIYRKPSVIIPYGQTIIRANDKLLVVSSSKEQQMVIDFVKQTKDVDK